MATLTTDRSQAAAVPAPHSDPIAGPLIVATDASTASDSALRLARAIAGHSGRAVLVLSVHVPTPLAAPELAMATPPGLEAERRAALRQQVVLQMSRAGIAEPWPITLVSGDPAAQIVKLATTLNASLVIMGLGQHGLFERLLGDETVLRVLRLGTVPVLAVPPGCDILPRRVLAAIDFTPSSVRAAALAAEVMFPAGTLTLAHVITGDVDPANWLAANAPYQGTMGRAFDLAIAQIAAPPSITVQRYVLAGDPAKTVTELAGALHKDLLVSGSHGHGFLTRLRLGSVSQKIVRTARCLVLVAPPSAGRTFLEEVPEATTRFASYEWSERLEEFTRRNASRTATLEIIDPELGAQVEEKGFPFMGAAFDPRDATVQIMLGEGTAQARGRHLTRRIEGVTAIQVLRDQQGEDLLLRVAHGRGQTLLTLDR